MNNIRFEYPKAIRRSGLPSTTRHVLLTLTTYMNPAGICSPSQAQLALDCGLTERTVGEHLRGAERAGWIKTNVRKSQVNPWLNKHYKALIPTGRSDKELLQPNSGTDRNLTQTLQEPDSRNHQKHVPTNNSQNNNLNNASCFADSNEEFDLLWDTFPRNPKSKKLTACHEWEKLTIDDRDDAVAAAITFAISLERASSGVESLADKLMYAPHLSNWLRSRSWLG